NSYFESLSEFEKSLIIQENTELLEEFKAFFNIKICFFNGFLKAINSSFYIEESKLQNIKNNQNVPLFAYIQYSKISIFRLNISNNKFGSQGILQSSFNKITIQNSLLENMDQFLQESQRVLQQNVNLGNLLQLQIFPFLFDDSVIYFNQVNINNISCNNQCTAGILNFRNSFFNILESNFSSLKSSQGSALNIKNYKEKSSNLIYNSKFINNESFLNGGSIYILNQSPKSYKMQIQQCQISKNKAQAGGGLYIGTDAENFNQNQLFIIEDTIISENIAQKGGGILYYNTIINMINTQFAKNKSIIGQDQLLLPSILVLENLKEIKQQQFQFEQINQSNTFILKNIRSGDKIPIFIFSLYDSLGQKYFLETSEEQKNEKLEIQISPKTQNIQKYYIRGPTLASYDVKTATFQFLDMELIGEPGKKCILQIKSLSNLIKITDVQKNTIQDYSFEIQVEINPCKMGEYPKIYNQFTECITCLQGTFSYDLKDCYLCPKEAICGNQQIIKVLPGYWRKGFTSQNIYSCEGQKENCIGGLYGDSKEDNLCYEGHLGPFCIECDIQGNIWGESYSKEGKYSCSKCSEMKYNYIIIIILTIWTFISMVAAVLSEFKDIQKQQIFRTIKVLDDKRLYLRNNINNMTSVYVKIFTNYFQIVSCISKFDIGVQADFLLYLSSIGQPIQQTMNSFDCAIKDIPTEIPLIYLRLIFSLIMPIFYVICFIIFLFVKKQFQSKVTFLGKQFYLQ
ncbi:hypothetical protein IMG5_146280, partial [Ichthyophthirius multifiliis]